MNIDRNNDNNEDRLSELPDELVIRILSSLPIEDAVQTMLLRRLGSLWRLVPTVEFSDNNSPNFVSNVLNSLNNATIDKVEFNEVDVGSQENLDNWVDIGLRKKPKMFTIRINDMSQFNLPPRVLTNQWIVYLVLHNVVINCPLTVDMISLRKLELSNIYLHDKVMKSITSGCSLLREVVIRNPGETYLLDITTAPQVEKLVLDLSQDDSDEAIAIICPNIRILHVEEACMDYLALIDISSVVEFVIKDCYCDYCCESQECFGFENVLPKCPNAYIIRLETEAYLRLKSCGNDQKMAYPNNIWTRIALRPTIEGSCLVNICSLLKTSVYLEDLVIYADVDYLCECNILVRKRFRRCVMRELKRITIREFRKPCKALLELIKFLLRSANVLEQIIICCIKNDKTFSKEGQEFINEVLDFPWASGKAVASIVFV